MTPMSRLYSPQYILIAALLIASIAVTAWLLFYNGTDMLVATFWRSFDWVQQHRLVALLLFFVISIISQLIVMPSGSLMLLLAGFALGALPAAAVFATAQVVAAWPVYTLSRRAVKPVEEGFARGVDTHRMQKILDKLASLRGNEILATAVLRLTPVIPSAGACLLAVMCDISLRSFLIGTLLTCWIRPLFFASSGAAMSSVLMDADINEAISGLDVTPLILVFVSVLIMAAVGRRFSS